MRRKIVISSALLITVLAIGGGLAVTHKFPFERPAAPSAAASTPPPAVPIVAGTVAMHDVLI